MCSSDLIANGFLKIETRGLGGAGPQIPVVEVVEVGGENLALGPSHFEATGGEGFVDFSQRAALRRRRGDFDQLLGNRGSSRDDSSFGEKIPSCPQGGKRVDSPVVVEAFVLSGERAGDEVCGYFSGKEGCRA